MCVWEVDKMHNALQSFWFAQVWNCRSMLVSSIYWHGDVWSMAVFGSDHKQSRSAVSWNDCSCTSFDSKLRRLSSVGFSSLHRLPMFCSIWLGLEMAKNKPHCTARYPTSQVLIILWVIRGPVHAGRRSWRFLIISIWIWQSACGASHVFWCPSCLLHMQEALAA